MSNIVSRLTVIYEYKIYVYSKVYRKSVLDVVPDVINSIITDVANNLKILFY